MDKDKYRPKDGLHGSMIANNMYLSSEVCNQVISSISEHGYCYMGIRNGKKGFFPRNLKQKWLSDFPYPNITSCITFLTQIKDANPSKPKLVHKPDENKNTNIKKDGALCDIEDQTGHYMPKDGNSKELADNPFEDIEKCKQIVDSISNRGYCRYVDKDDQTGFMPRSLTEKQLAKDLFENYEDCFAVVKSISSNGYCYHTYNKSKNKSLYMPKNHKGKDLTSNPAETLHICNNVLDTLK